MKKIVLTYGTFDLLHVGHLNLLRRLRALGDELLVGVSTDAFNALKGKQTIICFDDRIELIRNLKCVTHAFPEERWDQKVDDIKRLGISIFGMGDDWKGRFDDLSQHCQVIYLPRTEGISSSDLKSILRLLDRPHVNDLKKALDTISSIIEKLE